MQSVSYDFLLLILNLQMGFSDESSFKILANKSSFGKQFHDHCLVEMVKHPFSVRKPVGAHQTGDCKRSDNHDCTKTIAFRKGR